MYVNTSTLEIASRHQIKQQHPNVSLPKEPTDDQLEPLGFAVLHPTDPPEGDVVTQGTPELLGGKWHQTWDMRSFTPEELATQLDDAKERKSREIDEYRDEAINAGFSHAFPDGPDVVQTRARDRENIIGLAVSAQLLIANGDENTMLPFRAESDITHQLAATDVLELAQAAQAHVGQQYATAWQLKSTADAAHQAQDREALSAITWPQ